MEYHRTRKKLLSNAYDTGLHGIKKKCKLNWLSMRKSMELSMGTITKLPMQKLHENSIRHRKFQIFSFHWKWILCFMEKGKFKFTWDMKNNGKFYLFMAIWSSWKKMPFHLNHRTNQSARLIIMVSLDVGEHWTTSHNPQYNLCSCTIIRKIKIKTTN